MEISKEAIDAARARAEEMGPCAVSARYRPYHKVIEVKFDNGVMLTVPTRLIQGLAGARAADLVEIEITPAGQGLHFPLIDADVFAPALFEGIYGSKAWMKHSASAAGSTRSPAKSAAARENGKKGGRPRKVQEVAHT